jgi:hypothetical protein
VIGNIFPAGPGGKAIRRKDLDPGMGCALALLCVQLPGMFGPGTMTCVTVRVAISGKTCSTTFSDPISVTIAAT